MFGEVREQNIYATRRSRNLNAAFPFSPPPGRPFPGRNERKSIRFGERPRLLPALFAVTSPPAPLLLAHLAFKQANQEKDGRTRGKIGKEKVFEDLYLSRSSFFFLDRRKPKYNDTRDRPPIDRYSRTDGLLDSSNGTGCPDTGLPPTRIGKRSNSGEGGRGTGSKREDR